MNPKPWHDCERLKVDYYRLGSRQAVAKLYGCANTTIGSAIIACGILDVAPWYDCERLDADLNRLGTQTAVSELYGCMPKTISHAIRNCGITIDKGEQYDCEQLQADYYRLGSRPAVAQLYGCANSTIRGAINKCGIQYIEPWRDCEQLKVDYYNLGTQSALAAEYNCSLKTISRAIKRCGVTIDKEAPCDCEQLKRDYYAAGGYRALAAEYGWSESKVSHRIRRCGILSPRMVLAKINPECHLDDREWLEAAYATRSTKALGEFCNISAYAIMAALKTLQIPAHPCSWRPPGYQHVMPKKRPETPPSPDSAFTVYSHGDGWPFYSGAEVTVEQLHNAPDGLRLLREGQCYAWRRGKLRTAKEFRKHIIAIREVVRNEISPK